MNLLKKNKSDLLLAFLFLESVLLSMMLDSKGFFWMLFIASSITMFFYAILFLELPIKKFLDNDKKYDVFLVVVMTAMFNANVMVFSNRLVLAISFAIYYVGLRALMGMFKKGLVNQVQKNALNLSVLLTVFLGSNLLTNITIAVEKALGEFVILPATAILFAFIYLISYYNFIKNRISKKWARLYSVVLSIILSETALIAGFYLERYPSIYKVESTSNMSIVTLPLFLVVIYYMIYGLMIHKLEKRLTSRILMEYVGISVVITLTLFITIRWFQ